MSLLRCIRNSVFHFRREAFSTSTVYKCMPIVDDAEPSKPNPKDKREVISVETSILYLKSKEYKLAYGEFPVWKFYRRNFKGNKPPRTRRNCFNGYKLNNSSPCPICRDKYLVLDYQNVDLLKQFISEHGQYILDSYETGICQNQQKNLLVAIAKAKDYGLITFDAPFRYYNYKYYKNM